MKMPQLWGEGLAALVSGTLSRLIFLWLRQSAKGSSHTGISTASPEGVSCLTTQDWEITGGKDKLQLCTSARWPHVKVSCQLWLLPLPSRRNPLSQNCSCSSLLMLRISRCALHPENLGTLWGLDSQDRHVVGACPHTDCCGHCCSTRSWGQDETWKDTGNFTETCQPHRVGITPGAVTGWWGVFQGCPKKALSKSCSVV